MAEEKDGDENGEVLTIALRSRPTSPQPQKEQPQAVGKPNREMKPQATTESARSIAAKERENRENRTTTPSSSSSLSASSSSSSSSSTTKSAGAATAAAAAAAATTAAMEAAASKLPPPKSQPQQRFQPLAGAPAAKQPGRNRPVRPTLSDQLAAIGDRAGDITSSLRNQHGLNTNEADAVGRQLLMTAPSRSFGVGRLQCRFPSPVHFWNDRAVYIFHHPFQTKEITMEMHYRDMEDFRVSRTQRRLQFRINHALEQFGDDYDCSNHRHVVAIELSSDCDFQQMMRSILPRIKRAGRA